MKKVFQKNLKKTEFLEYLSIASVVIWTLVGALTLGFMLGFGFNCLLK